MQILERGADAYEHYHEFCQYSVSNYYNYPGSATAFVEGMRNASMVAMDGVVFRRVGNTFTLVGYDDLAHVRDAYTILADLGHKIKSLSYEGVDGAAPGLILKPYNNGWYIHRDWSIDEVIGQHDRKGRYHLRRCIRDGESLAVWDMVGRDEAFELFWNWVAVKKSNPKGSMVVQGFGRRELELYYDGIAKNTYLHGLRSLASGELWGMWMYELHPTLDSACILICKNRLDDQNTFPNIAKYMWMHGLTSLLEDHTAARLVYCGTMSDKIKRYLGMQCEKTKRILADVSVE